MKRRWWVVLGYALLVGVLLTQRSAIMDWLERGEAPIGWLFVVAVVLAFVPVVPYKLVIGTLGILYGPLTGAAMSWAATTIASVVIFGLVRSFGQRQGRAYLARNRHTDRLSRLMERKPFLSIALVRLLAVFPSLLVNVYAALLSIRFSTFILATAIGKIPAMLTFAFLGHELLHDWRTALGTALVYAAFIILLLIIYRRWERRQT
ncbi:VTT domain-containing protein [Paenibacillus sp. PR3]|uniref:TVP38/TMEM64 family membrane protein n=1 Tax=Paenibacillus terricola TaxID=2763503 RepID=A0ABR8N267_9BACL|nr:VTT domain-containing protein [Paenibacillus terricola]MBD3921300.1 VTT domain-containing protein [Paenibacillus terricola]